MKTMDEILQSKSKRDAYIGFCFRPALPELSIPFSYWVRYQSVYTFLVADPFLLRGRID